MKESREKLFGFLAIFLFGILLYFPALKGDFHFDDFHHIINNPAVINPPGIRYFFTHPESFSSLGKPTLYRPITMLSYVVNYKLAGKHPAGWLIFNILLHSLNAGLVFLFFLRLGRKFSLSFYAGLIFASLAVFSQPVNYLSNRSTLLAVFFLFLAFLFDQKYKEGHSQILNLFLALGFFWLGLLSKEISAVFPALILLVDLRSGREAFSKKRIISYLVYWANWGIYFLIRWLLFDTLGSNFYPRGFFENFLTQIKAVFFYLGKIFYPINLCVIPQLKVAENIFEPLVLISLLGAFLLSLISILYFGRLKNFAFGWFWFLISLSPTAVIPLNVVASEERVYLAGIGVIFWIPAVFERAELAKKSWAKISLILIIIFQAILVEMRIPVWRSEFSLWKDAVRKSPNLSAGYVMYGNALLGRENYGRALLFYQRALQLDPNNASALSGLCQVYLAQKDSEAVSFWAVEYLNKAQHPYQRAEALSYLAWANLQLGEIKTSQELIEKAISLNPRVPWAYYTRAVSEYNQGKIEQAKKDAEKVLEITPDFASVYGLLGLIYARQGMVERAFQYFRRYNELKPRDAEGWLNLGLAYFQKGDLEQAYGCIKQATKLKPKYALANYHLALIEYQRGKWENALDFLDITLEIDPELVPAHIARAKILLENLKKGNLPYFKSKEEVFEIIGQEIDWLEKKGIDTEALKEELAELKER